MAVCFSVGTELGRNDLSIFLVDELGVPVNAAEIYYSIYFVDESVGPPGIEVLIGPEQRIPVNPSVGEYYAALLVPPGASAGDYRIRWTFRRTLMDEYQEVVQEFGVSNPASCTDGQPLMSNCEAGLVDKLRVMIRDNNPDRNYHFRPPEQEGVVGKYNRVFGYIWEDHELLCYLQMSLDWFNSFPPATPGISSLNALCTQMPQWRTFILWGAAVHALFALSINWVADEFDYSIGGISLSLEKSSKYESLKNNAEGQFDKATEAKARTVKFIRGVQQSKFGFGVRSSFGPNVGRGVLSPRSFVALAVMVLSQGFLV
jgi:hypothetical protein